MKYSNKEKEMFESWSKVMTAEEVEKKKKEYFQEKKEIEKFLKSKK